MCITYKERKIKQRPGNHKKQQRNYSEYDITGPTVLQNFMGILSLINVTAPPLQIQSIKI